MTTLNKMVQKRIRKVGQENAQLFEKRHMDRAIRYGCAGSTEKDRLKFKEWIEVLLSYEHTCLKCGSNSSKMNCDHIVPISKGGPNLKYNIQPLCGGCNKEKFILAEDYRPNPVPRLHKEFPFLTKLPGAFDPVPMLSKFAGRCAKCKRKYPSGTPIKYFPLIKKAEHADCNDSKRYSIVKRRDDGIIWT